MTTIKFSKSVKYKGVRYAAHETFKVADEDVAQLVEQGATVLSVDAPVDDESVETGEDKDSEESEEDESDEDVDQLREVLLTYSVPDLVDFAKKRGINLQGKTRKADVYNVIVASLN